MAGTILEMEMVIYIIYFIIKTINSAIEITMVETMLEMKVIILRMYQMVGVINLLIGIQIIINYNVYKYTKTIIKILVLLRIIIIFNKQMVITE